MLRERATNCAIRPRLMSNLIFGVVICVQSARSFLDKRFWDSHMSVIFIYIYIKFCTFKRGFQLTQFVSSEKIQHKFFRS